MEDSRDIERRVQRVRTRPHEDEGWIDLARAVQRTDHQPDFLEVEEHLELLLSLWRRHPGERSLEVLVLPLLGLEVPPDSDEPGKFWEQSGRLRADHERYYDSESGMPLEVVVPGIGLRLVWTPPGFFSRSEERHGEQVQQNVTIPRGFWMSRTPLTWRQIQGLGLEDGLQEADAPDLPVDCLDTWTGYLTGSKITQGLKGSSKPPEGWSYRLPTEAEWEYAARGGRTAPLNLDELLETGWFEENSGGCLHPVGQKSRTPFGHQDMLGNVQELCLGRVVPYVDGDRVEDHLHDVGGWRWDWSHRGGGFSDRATQWQPTRRGNLRPGPPDEQLHEQLLGLGELLSSGESGPTRELAPMSRFGARLVLSPRLSLFTVFHFVVGVPSIACGSILDQDWLFRARGDTWRLEINGREVDFGVLQGAESDAFEACPWSTSSASLEACRDLIIDALLGFLEETPSLPTIKQSVLLDAFAPWIDELDEPSYAWVEFPPSRG